MRNEFLRGIGEVACHFLLDGSPLPGPFVLSVLNVLHTRSVYTQREIQILGRDGDEILRSGLLRISISKPAELGIDRRNLIAAQIRAPAECHVLLGMRHSWEAGWGLVPAS